MLSRSRPQHKRPHSRAHLLSWSINSNTTKALMHTRDSLSLSWRSRPTTTLYAHSHSLDLGAQGFALASSWSISSTIISWGAGALGGVDVGGGAAAACCTSAMVGPTSAARSSDLLLVDRRWMPRQAQAQAARTQMANNIQKTHGCVHVAAS